MSRGEVQRCLATMDCPEYWLRVDSMLAEEEERVRAYLDAPTTETKLLDRVDQELIRSQVSSRSSWRVLQAPRMDWCCVDNV